MCFDKYVKSSIKGWERKLRGARNISFCITGSELRSVHQIAWSEIVNQWKFQRPTCSVSREGWQQDYLNIYQGKILFVFYIGNCFQYVPDQSQHVSVLRPARLQDEHEEADTLCISWL